MALPLKTQLFRSFMGQSQGVHSILLPDVYSSGGSKNLWMDRFARAQVIDGYAKQNGVAITTDTGGSAVLFQGLLPYRSGAMARQVLAVVDDGVDEYEVWKSSNDGGSYSFLVDLGAGSVGSLPDSAQFGDSLYFTNGVLGVRKYDGTTWSTAGRTQSPTITAAASATTGLLEGSYTYKLVSMVGSARQAASVASAVLQRQKNQASLSWTADANGSVTGYEIYRTTGTGNRFLFLAYVDGRTTVAFTDNISDQVLVENRLMAEHGDAPPTGVNFLEPHKQRMWYARTSAFPTRVWYSDPGLPEDVYINNNIDFTDSETVGDRITGLIGNFQGSLVVGTEKTIWVLSGTGNVFGNVTDWNRRKTNVDTGWASHRCATRVPSGAKYLDEDGNMASTDQETIAYWTPLGDIRLFDGQNDMHISNPVMDLLETANYAQRHKVFVIHDVARQEITWVYPDGSSGVPNKAVTWGYAYGVWYPRDWTQFSCGCVIDTSAAAQLILAGSNATSIGGFAFQLWSGNSFNGSNIPAQWMTKTLYGKAGDTDEPEMSRTKRWRWVDLLLKANQTQSFTIEWMPGNVTDDGAASGSQVVSTAAGHILSADGSRVVSLTGSPLAVGQASTQVKVLLKGTTGRYLHHPGIRIRISSNNTNGAWALESMNLAYNVLPGQKRRMQ